MCIAYKSQILNTNMLVSDFHETHDFKNSEEAFKIIMKDVNLEYGHFKWHTTSAFLFEKKLRYLQMFTCNNISAFTETFVFSEQT